jgi:hypothetical protein
MYDLWEGDAACKELSRLGLLGVVSLEQNKGKGLLADWRMRHTIEHLEAELRTYQLMSGKVLETRRQMNFELQLLASTKKKFVEHIARYPSSNHRWSKKYLRMILADTKKIRHEQGRLWLGHRGAWRRLLLQPEYRRRPLRELDLEGRFQIRVAKTMRTSLQKDDGVTLRTVARLVVLFYLCAGLAEDKKDYIEVKNTGRELSVDAVDQKLRHALIDEPLG